jgi:hypothetical protein
MIAFVSQDTPVSRTGLAYQESDVYGSSVLHMDYNYKNKLYVMFYSNPTGCTIFFFLKSF